MKFSKFTAADTKLTVLFGDNVPKLEIDIGKMSPEVLKYASLHGLKQRIGDNAAGAKTEIERRAALSEISEFYMTGTADWNLKTRTPARNPVFTALAEELKCTYEEAELRWANSKLADLAKFISG